MGMLMYHQRQKQRQAESAESTPDPAGRPLDRQNKAELQETARTLGVSDEGSKAELRDRIKAKRSESTEPPASPYAELTDEHVAEAYATNVDGEAEGREAQQAELEALDAENESHED